MSTSSHTPPFIVTEAATFVGIDHHKKYSVWHALDAAEGVRERNLTKLWKMDELSGCPDSFASSIPALVIM